MVIIIFKKSFSSAPNDEDHYGSVMFECGLQGLELRAVKRVSNSNQKTSNNSKVTLEQETSAATDPAPESDPSSAPSSAPAAGT